MKNSKYRDFPLAVSLFFRKFAAKTKLMGIPKSVINEASGLISRYGERLVFLGKYDEADVFLFQFPADLDVGTTIFLDYKNGECIKLSNLAALPILNLLVKN